MKASDKPADLGQQDAVISTLKATGLPALADSVGPLLGPDTPVVFAQNGIPWWYGHGLDKSRPPAPDLSRLDPGGALAKAVGLDRTLGGAITSPNHVVEPGVVANDIPDRNQLWVGEIDDRPSQRVGALRAALKAAGIGSPETTDIRYDIWHKLMANLTGSTVCPDPGPALVGAEDAAGQSSSAAAPMPRRWRSPRRTASCSTTAPTCATDPSASTSIIVRRSCRTTTSAGRWRSKRSSARRSRSPAAPASMRRRSSAIEALTVSLAAAKGLYNP